MGIVLAGTAKKEEDSGSRLHESDDGDVGDERF